MPTHLTAGVDAGSSSVKVAVMESRAGDDGRVKGVAVQRIRRRKVADVVRGAFDEALAAAGVAEGDLCYTASTGDGDAAPFATGHFYGLTTHARGALFLAPEARAALDIGALHGRVIRFDERGKVLAHRMTSQCASGSGQFLENIARYLGVTLREVGDLSLSSRRPEEVSSICAVLAETDVINMVSRGISPADILKGIHRSIAGRLVRLLGAVGATGVVAITGGLAHDKGLLACVNEMLAASPPSSGGVAQSSCDHHPPPAPGAAADDCCSGARGAAGAPPSCEARATDDAILAGAIGAALLAARRHEQLARAGRLQTSVSS